MFLVLQLVIFVCLSNAIDVTYSHQRGYYTESFDLELSCPQIVNPTILYTTTPLTVRVDATTKTGTVYTSPISITTTTVIQSICYGDTDASDITSHTYIYISKVISSSLMKNTAITQSPVYAPMLPVVLNYTFVSMTYYQTLLNNGLQNLGYFEYYEPDTGVSIGIPCNFEIFGGLSATWDRTSFRAHFVGDFEYDLYKNYQYGGNPPVDKFTVMNIRASQDAYGWFTGPTFVRNWFFDQLQLRMGNLAPHGRFVHLYHNVDYWGVYHLREDWDNGKPFSYYYGGKKENYTFVNYPDGTTAPQWTSAVSACSNFATASQYVDLQNYINYFLTELYSEDTDWGGHNWQAGGLIPAHGPAQGWKFFCSDMDLTFWDASRSVINIIPSVMWSGLKTLPDFMTMFSDTLYRECVNPRGVFVSTNTIPLWISLYNQIADIIIADCARWGINSHRNWNIPDSRTTNATTVSSILPQRCSYLVSQLTSQGWYSTVAVPMIDKYGGSYDPLPSITLTSSNTVYYTLDGTDPRLLGGSISSTAIKYTGIITLPGPITTLRARAWKSANSWSPLIDETYVYKSAPCWLCGHVVMSEIMYNPQFQEGKWVELKNIGNTTIDLNGAYFDQIYYKFRPHTLIEPGGFFVVGYDVWQFYDIHKVALSDKCFGTISNDGIIPLNLYDALGRVVFQAFFDKNYPWPEGSNDLGYTLVLANEVNFTSVYATSPTDWRRSCNLKGSPFVDDPYCPDPPITVIINEVLFTSTSGNWIELYNTGNTDVDISKWKLSNNTIKPKMYSVGSGTMIPSKGYLTVKQSDYAFNLGFDSNVYFWSTISGSTLTSMYNGLSLGVVPSDVSYGIYRSINGKNYTIPLMPTKGSPNVPYIGPLYISQLPLKIYNPITNVDYIKLKTNSMNSIDLTGWKLSGDVTFNFPSLQLDPLTDLYLFPSTSSKNDLKARLGSSIGSTAIVLGPYVGSLKQQKQPLEIILLRPVDNNYTVADLTTYNGFTLVSLNNFSIAVWQRIETPQFGEEFTSWTNGYQAIIKPPDPAPVPLKPLQIPQPNSQTPTNPSTTNPSTTNPSTTNPSTTNPSTTNPSTPHPSTTNPSTTNPSTTNPSTTNPSTTNPSSVKPPGIVVENGTIINLGIDSNNQMMGFYPGLGYGESIGLTIAIIIIILLIIGSVVFLLLVRRPSTEIV